jgi:hypothetical protein
MCTIYYFTNDYQIEAGSYQMVLMSRCPAAFEVLHRIYDDVDYSVLLLLSVSFISLATVLLP